MSIIPEFKTLNGDKVREFVCLYLKNARQEAEDFCKKHFPYLMGKRTVSLEYCDELDRIATCLFGLLAQGCFKERYDIMISGNDVIYRRPCEIIQHTDIYIGSL